ncbi:MAG TPA: hypothetical protein VFQ77_15475 [Pseudonocardiaceae bacterium]|nr:hypothetical protein [Pseudonocardiaceae bacterium]
MTGQPLAAALVAVSRIVARITPADLPLLTVDISPVHLLAVVDAQGATRRVIAVPRA